MLALNVGAMIFRFLVHSDTEINITER